MNLTTTDVVVPPVPATTKTVVSDVQRISTKGSGINMEVNMRSTGRGATIATYRIDGPHAQSGDAASFRQLAEFLTAIADEMEKRSAVQS